MAFTNRQGVIGDPTLLVRNIFFITALLLAAFCSEVRAEPELPSKERSRILDSCVEVLVGGRLRGGGVVVKSGHNKPLVVTASHLFGEVSFEAEVLTSTGERLAAKVVGVDLGHDLALLELSDSEKGDFKGLPIAAKTPAVTETVFQFGPALRRRMMTITGKVADDRDSFSDFTPSRGYLEHYFVAALTPVLTSGGPWVNRAGEVVGIQNGRLNDEGTPSSGLSLVAPVHAIQRLVEQRKIMETPTIRAWVWELWTAGDDFLAKLPDGTKGLLISKLSEGSPLARAGAERLEVITACDGVGFSRRHELMRLLWAKPAGSKFELEVLNLDTKESRMIILTTEAAESEWLEKKAE